MKPHQNRQNNYSSSKNTKQTIQFPRKTKQTHNITSVFCKIIHDFHGYTDLLWQIDRFFFEKEKNSSMSKKNIFLSFLVLEYIAKKGKQWKAQTLYIICEKLHKYVNKKNLCSRVPTEQQKNQQSTTTISITIEFCEKSEGEFTTLLVSQEVLKNRHCLLSFRYFLVS